MTMKVSKRDVTILLIALGAILAFCVFQFYFRKAMDEKKSIEEENKKLQERLDKFNNIDENKLLAEMQTNSDDLATRSEGYPSAYRYEDLIMYLNEWQILPYEEMYYFPQYTITETIYEESASGVLNWDAAGKKEVEASYWFGKSTIDAQYGSSSYKAFKDMINKIYLDPAPKTIRSVTAQMDRASGIGQGIVSGNIIIDFQNIQNGSNTYTPVEITGVPTSVENIFGPTFTPTPTATPTPRPTRRAED